MQSTPEMGVQVLNVRVGAERRASASDPRRASQEANGEQRSDGSGAAVVDDCGDGHGANLQGVPSGETLREQAATGMRAPRLPKE